MMVDEADFNYEDAVNLVKNITFSSQSIAQTIKGNTEPFKEIFAVVEQLNERADHILQAIKQDEELCKDLIIAFRQMAEAMLDEHIIMDKEYVVAIFKLFHALTTLFYGPLMTRLDACQLIDTCWNDAANLYQAIFP